MVRSVSTRISYYRGGPKDRKLANNKLIVDSAKDLKDIVALFLDNAEGNTEKEFLAITDKLYTVNDDKIAYDAIVARGISTAYYGKLSEHIHIAKKVAPNVIYLDFCCTVFGNRAGLYPLQDILDILKAVNRSKIVFAVTFATRMNNLGGPLANEKVSDLIYDSLENGIFVESQWRVVGKGQYISYSGGPRGVGCSMMFCLFTLEKDRTIPKYTAVYQPRYDRKGGRTKYAWGFDPRRKQNRIYF